MILSWFNALFHLQLAVNVTFNDASRRCLIMLESDLASGLIQIRVGLNESSAWLLFGEDYTANLAAPVVRVNVGHLIVHLDTFLNITRRLIDVNLLEVVTDG